MSTPQLPTDNHVNNTENQIEDYLEEDKPIPGQKYACLSFISPDKVLHQKQEFLFYEFMKEQFSKNESCYEKTFEQFREDLKFYQEDNEEKLQESFDNIVDYQTNVRGVKVRGVYDNLRAANIRAKVLQKLDRSFHVYVGQVGYWLPWDPTANNVEDQEYAEPELNRLVKEYKQNETKKDLFYEEQKREKQKAALEESLRLKKVQEEEKQQEESERLAREEEEKQKLLDELANTEIADEDATEEAEEGEVNTVSIKTTPKEEQTQLSSDNVVDEELKQSLDSVDPWMARKMEDSSNQ